MNQDVRIVLSSEMSSVTTILFVRHCESESNAKLVLSTTINFDLPLTSGGRRDAIELSRSLQRYSPVHVFTSGLMRAVATGTMIAESCGTGLTVSNGFNEINVGELDGRHDEAAWEIHWRILAKWKSGEHDVRFPGGENLRETKVRLQSEIDEASRAFPESVICIVTHGALLAFVLPHLCDDLMAAVSSRRIKRWLPLGGVSVFDASNGLSLRGWNILHSHAPHFVSPSVSNIFLDCPLGR